MRERGIGDLEWNDREAWRKKIIFTLGTERCENIKNLHINKYIIIIIIIITIIIIILLSAFRKKGKRQMLYIVL